MTQWPLVNTAGVYAPSRFQSPHSSVEPGGVGTLNRWSTPPSHARTRAETWVGPANAGTLRTGNTGAVTLPGVRAVGIAGAPGAVAAATGPPARAPAVSAADDQQHQPTADDPSGPACRCVRHRSPSPGCAVHVSSSACGASVQTGHNPAMPPTGPREFSREGWTIRGPGRRPTRRGTSARRSGGYGTMTGGSPAGARRNGRSSLVTGSREADVREHGTSGAHRRQAGPRPGDGAPGPVAGPHRGPPDRPAGQDPHHRVGRAGRAAAGRPVRGRRRGHPVGQPADRRGAGPGRARAGGGAAGVGRAASQR